MSRRPLVLAAIMLGATAFAACGDLSTPTQPPAMKTAAPAHPSLATSCGDGGWSSSTGRCE